MSDPQILRSARVSLGRWAAALVFAISAVVSVATAQSSAAAPVPQAAAASADADQDLGRWSDEVFGAAYRDGKFSSMSLVVLRGGEEVLHRAYGAARYGPDVPLDRSRTRLLIGSITKTFTGIAVLQLVESGRIRSIDDPANAYLKRLQLPGDRGARITIKDLLTHSAGYELRNSGVGAHEVIPTPVSGKLAERLAPGLVRDPGALVSYSNYATALLGLIVEDVTGEEIEGYFKREIWTPLGMTSAHFVRGMALEPDAAASYRRGPDGAFKSDHFIAFNPLYWPVGSVALTLDDAARYLRFHRDRSRGVEGPVLNVAQHRRLTSVMRRNHPEAGGFGFQIMGYDWNGRTLFGHGGTWVGYESMLLVSPADDVAFFFSIAGPRGMGNILATKLLLTRVFGVDAPPRAIAAVDQSALQEFAGVYRPTMRADTRIEGVLPYLGGGDAAVVEVTSDGLQIAGDGPYAPLGGDLFYRADAHQTGANPFALPRIGFYRDASGRVAGLTSQLGFTPMERVGQLADPRWAAAGLKWWGWALLLAVPALFWPMRSWGDVGVKVAAVVPAICAFAWAPVLTHDLGAGGLNAYVIDGRTLRFVIINALANASVASALVLAAAAVIWNIGRAKRALWIRAHVVLIACLATAWVAILFAAHLAGVGRA